MTAAPDSNIRGVAFAPTQATSTPTVTSVTSNTTSTGIIVTSGSSLDVLSGGTAVAATILSGASATISGGGTDSGSTIAQGGNETVLGTASGDFVDGIQLVSAATAVVTNDMVFNGGSVELFLKGAIANSPTVEAGGSILISGNATANNAVLSGGLIELEFVQGRAVRLADILRRGRDRGGRHQQRRLWRARDHLGIRQRRRHRLHVRDLIGAAGSAATLTTATVSGNTVATVSGGGSSQAFTLAGTTLANFLALMSDGHGGEELTFSAPPPTTSTITSGSTQSNLVIAGGSFLDILSGGTAVSATILSGGSATVELGGTNSASTITSGGFETVSGSATLDQIYGTQLISAATAVVSNETVFNGGSADLFLKGAIANTLTVDSGGSLNISGNATANNTVVSGGEVELQSPKANSVRLDHIQQHRHAGRHLQHQRRVWRPGGGLGLRQRGRGRHDLRHLGRRGWVGGDAFYGHVRRQHGRDGLRRRRDGDVHLRRIGHVEPAIDQRQQRRRGDRLHRLGLDLVVFRHLGHQREHAEQSRGQWRDLAGRAVRRHDRQRDDPGRAAPRRCNPAASTPRP